MRFDRRAGSRLPKPSLDTYSYSAGGSLPYYCYFNTDGRIHDAVSKAEAHGGKVLKKEHAIGPHGFRALLLDSEGNRMALHSNTDA